MTKRQRLVMATNNAGKLREARAIAGDRLEILSLDDIGYHHDIPETADTLEGNALIKVRTIKEATGLDCFADDTGLMVEALGGAPGVYTARYAGEGCTPDDNIELMLKNLQGVTDRRACFRTCVALSLNGEEHVFEGAVDGKIATERSGSHGFGYDPIFIPDETGICFADMTDEAKNEISHRGRAVSAMMKWLASLCLAILAVLPAKSAATSDWILYNTFDDQIENVFDTPYKTYFLVQAQYQDANNADNIDKLCFLFCLEKDSGEIRAYTSQNFLSQSLIRRAYYNALKRYLLIIYDDNNIELLYDDGNSYVIPDLKNFSTSGAKEARGITFAPAHDLAYVATDFGYIAINDKKHEIASSGIYGEPIDKVVQVAGHLLILRNGKLYRDKTSSQHISIDDFKEVNWLGSEASDIYNLSADKCLIVGAKNGQKTHYLLSFSATGSDPAVSEISGLKNPIITENKNGLFLDREEAIFEINRETGNYTGLARRAEDRTLKCGSWDMKEVFYAKPRTGFYSVRHNDDDSWTVTRDVARPNAPAAFRSNALMYTPQHGMLVNTHGQDQNFSSHNANNPNLLSGLKDGVWTMYGLPYLKPDMVRRITNPVGMAQDPDNPDIFYFGSTQNGVLRYNIKDGSSILHTTYSTDNPSMEGHVSLQDRYSYWGSVFMTFYPQFDTKGNLILAHTNTDSSPYRGELWIWPAANRRATVSPETFQPYVRIPLPDVRGNKGACAMPLKSAGMQDVVVYFPFITYDSEFFLYDHNGTPEQTSDDRIATMKSLFDDDGSVSYSYLYCAVEDPQTGLVWVGGDNGVFTFNPKEAFSNPGKVSRIKVSRNDGTSLADYLLAGTSVNNISIDGNGRKWFSLAGGGLVCTSADGKTIIQEVTSENSMLPSDDVYASCYNPDNNSLMIATSAGLCEYYLSGRGDSSAKSDVRVYPNPVRHDYLGWVTIDGLEDECIVKITDSAGNIVRELGPASGGKVEWDACGFNLDRVPSGVYFVLASSGKNGGSFIEVSKILVINN